MEKKDVDTSKGHHLPFDHAKPPVTGREPTAVPLLDNNATRILSALACV